MAQLKTWTVAMLVGDAPRIFKTTVNPVEKRVEDAGDLIRHLASELRFEQLFATLGRLDANAFEAREPTLDEFNEATRVSGLAKLDAGALYVLIGVSYPASAVDLRRPPAVRLAVKTDMPSPSHYNSWKIGYAVSDLPAGVRSQHAWATHRVMGFLPGQPAPPIPLELLEPAFAEFQDSLQRPLREGDAADTDALRACGTLLSAMRHQDPAEDSQTAQLRRVMTAFGIPVQADGAFIAAAPGSSPKGSTKTRGADTARAAASSGAGGRSAGRDTGTTSPREASSAESPWFGPTVTVNGVVARSDGTCVAGPHELLVLHIEGKLEGLPPYQNDAYAWKFSAYRPGGPGCDPAAAYTPAVAAEAEPRTPCFLVDLYGGSMLAVRGAAFAGYALLTQPLGSCDLTSVPGSAGAEQVARLLRALRAGVANISGRYARLPDSPALSPVEDLPLTALIHPGVIARVVQSAEPVLRSLVVREAVAGGSFVFLCDAVMQATDVGVGAGAASGSGASRGVKALPCILKFSRRYGADAQRVAASAKAAPSVYSAVTLPGGWIAILMEYLAPEDGWRHYGGSDAPVAEREAVCATYQRALAEHATVHGDLRSVNILVRCHSVSAQFGRAAAAAHSSGVRGPAAGSSSAGVSVVPLPQAADTSLSTHASAWEVRFVDFEFAGTAGAARYPHDLNLDVNRPLPDGELVRTLPGTLITHAHDVELICKGEPPAVAARHRGCASKRDWRRDP